MRAILFAAGSIAVTATQSSVSGAVAHHDPYDAKAQIIVDSFSVDEVIGQMTQVDISTVLNDDKTLDEDKVRAHAQQYVGSYLNTIWSQPVEDTYGWNATEWRAIVARIQNITMEENGGHPIIYGLDSVHGANYVRGAVMFGQQINSGASFNPKLVYKVGQITARDTQAAGILWVFGPILDLSQNSLWSRTYETFSEDPYLVTVMGEALVRGLQSLEHTAACLKHFIGYSKTPSGHDRDSVIMADFDLLNYFLPPYKAAIEAGALTIMENYASINGEPVVANSRILIDLLRSDLGFDGLLVTDWAEIKNLKDWHRVAETYEDAVRMSLTQTSIDMSMVPMDTNFINQTKTLLLDHPEYEDRLRESAKRIVKTKLKMGLYENPVPGKKFENMVGNDKDKDVALALARESIVLLQNNNNILPLPKQTTVFLTGHSADNIGYQCGGWSVAWQGYSGNEMFPNGVSVRHGFECVVGEDWFTYFNALNENGTYSDAKLTEAVKLASHHEYTVVVIGEKNYAEKPGDIDDLALPAGQIAYIEALAETNTKIILVLFEGRPRLLGPLPKLACAVIHGFLPGELGGQAVAEIIFGVVNPSGKLPITYPKDPANSAIPYYHRVNTQCAFNHCEMQWDFGTGLSYTEFNYTTLSIDTDTVTSADASVTATVTITNVGNRAGKETVMLFLTQPYRTISIPEVKMLKKFKKIDLQPGESREVSFVLTSKDWSVYVPQIGNGFKTIAEDTKYVIAIKPDTSCDVYNNVTNPLCAVFKIQTGRNQAKIHSSSVTKTSILPKSGMNLSMIDSLEDEVQARSVNPGNY
ncbi:putative glycoside hydrolase, family 3, glycoside hydrolase family 3 domain, immunoglobulin [Plasmopara halstedii]